MTTIGEERARLAAVGQRLRRREEWRADRAYTDARAVVEPATRVFVHITITNPSNYPTDDHHARAVEDIGIARFPNTGISYNRLLFQSGGAYEGQPIGRRGAHTVNDKRLAACVTPGCPGRGAPLTAPSWNLNVNSRAYVICQNVRDEVTDPQLDALARAIAADKLAGFVILMAEIHGHRCVAFKGCPADEMWQRMGELEALVAHYLRNGLTDDEEDDLPTPADLWNYLLVDPYNGAKQKAGDLLRWARIDSWKALVEVRALTQLVVADASNDITQEDLDAAKAEILAEIDATHPPEPEPPTT